MEISDVAMGKICQSDGLNIGVRGVADVNVTYTIEVDDVFLSAFPQGFVWTFDDGGIGGGEWGCSCVC
jgi:hypothetical protein